MKMKLNLEQMQEILGGTGGVAVVLKPVVGLPGILMGQHGDSWVIATREGRYQVFSSERDARNFLFCLELTSLSESMGMDTSVMNNRLMGFLDHKCHFVGE